MLLWQASGTCVDSINSLDWHLIDILVKSLIFKIGESEVKELFFVCFEFICKNSIHIIIIN